MPEEILVKEALSRERIEAGRRLIEASESKQLSITAAFWLFETDTGRWKLHLVTPLRENGPHPAYQALYPIWLGCGFDEGDLAFQDIRANAPSDPLATALTRAVSIKGKPGVRFSRNTVDGHYIEDAYIYKTS